ncbi:hypothetical protein GCM10012284_14830 [Mangrovihabitans endophyticus]|uniref:Uncharacterized protein n=1 Tax=Mangrovihabitans endophyticus TaxID=1751298 RepID=A0A8J3BXP4_9ACTN|nr:hypothetical protein GCM10012284_14830 [Mangrovihabitans endophyticus]
MKIRRAGARFAMVAALALSALFVAGQPASAAWKSCDLRVKVNQLRGYDANGKFNILVWKGSAEKSIHLKGVTLNATVQRKACDQPASGMKYYHWAMFKSGDFVRKGDGGYRNWAFFGNWKRPTDKHVIFKPR